MFYILQCSTVIQKNKKAFFKSTDVKMDRKKSVKGEQVYARIARGQTHDDSKSEVNNSVT